MDISCKNNRNEYVKAKSGVRYTGDFFWLLATFIEAIDQGMNAKITIEDPEAKELIFNKEGTIEDVILHIDNDTMNRIESEKDMEDTEDVAKNQKNIYYDASVIFIDKTKKREIVKLPRMYEDAVQENTCTDPGRLYKYYIHHTSGRGCTSVQCYK